MLQRNRQLFKKQIRYKFWVKQNLEKKIKLSFIKNYTLPYKLRLSLTIRENFRQSQQKYYISQNKLQCFLHYSFSVPSKKTQMSRFYLNRGVERLTLTGYQKI